MEEKLCDCGSCRSCNAHATSELDDTSCWRCEGAGCPTCERPDERKYYLERHSIVMFVINEDTDVRREYQACTHSEDGWAVYSPETLLNDKVHLYNLPDRSACIEDAKKFAAERGFTLEIY